MGANFKNVVLWIIVVLVLIILFQNLGPTGIQIFFWNIKLPLLLIMFVCFVLGGLVGWLLRWQLSRKQNRSTDSSTS